MPHSKIYEILSAIDVYSDGMVEKNYKGIAYIPWAKSWDKLSALGFCPVVEHSYVIDAEIAGVTVESTLTLTLPDTKERWTIHNSLPVLDGANKPITKGVTAHDINNTKQRNLVKCAALFGLGIAVYQKDTPDGDELYKHKQMDSKGLSKDKLKPGLNPGGL